MSLVTERYHIGYVPALTATELQVDILSKGFRMGAELSSIYVEVTGHIDVKFVVLAPPGHSFDERMSRRA